MLLIVKDANGQPQNVIVRAQGTPSDFSGAITTDNTPQALAAANPNRSGYVFQNTGTTNMLVNELGAGTVGANSFIVAPGAYWPPPAYDLVVTTALAVQGTAGDTYVYREW